MDSLKKWEKIRKELRVHVLRVALITRKAVTYWRERGVNISHRIVLTPKYYDCITLCVTSYDMDTLLGMVKRIGPLATTAGQETRKDPLAKMTCKRLLALSSHSGEGSVQIERSVTATRG